MNDMISLQGEACSFSTDALAPENFFQSFWSWFTDRYSRCGSASTDLALLRYLQECPTDHKLVVKHEYNTVVIAHEGFRRGEVRFIGVTPQLCSLLLEWIKYRGD